ncbi:hypothetical protein CK203_052337 [Vitis vinifera]|uniref:DUF4218 domain-containing protein n=1 Tax=Vitis vinifera TaxID=29760 RepID=A0A438H3E4_VITVI|nr:hypothetical protein CK203_052337 [Vitis vinifera]
MAQRYDTMDCGDVASTVEMVHAIEDEFMTDPMHGMGGQIKAFRFTPNIRGYAPSTMRCPYPCKQGRARNTKRIPAKVLWYFPPIPRNLRLAISADGINPHSSMTRPRQPGKDIDVYLAPLVDDLKTLWEVGVKAYDAHQQSKTKDGVKSRLDLLEMGLRPDLAPRNLVSMEELKLNGLKSHDYHALMQQLLPVAIRSVLPKHVRYAITRLCFFFNALCAKVVDVSRLNDIQQDIVVTLCLLEKYFPPSIFDIMLHLTVHLVREVRLCGPVYMRWMYPFERYMKVLKGYVRNHNRPEGCIAECYIAESLRVLYRVFIGHGCNWDSF